MRWRLAMLIRDKFKSHKLYGQWLIDFRTKNPSHVLSVTPQQTLNRYARAARFCDKFRIYDLRASGILPTSIYLMAKPENEEIVNERFLRQIKRRSLPVPEVERLLYQAKAIEGEFTEEAKPVVAEKVIVPPARSEELNMRVIDQAPVKHFEEEGQSVLSYPIENLSQDEIAYQILNYCEKFNLGSIKLVAVLQIAIKELQNQRYGKQVG
jgi:hypothetical protein